MFKAAQQFPAAQSPNRRIEEKSRPQRVQTLGLFLFVRWRMRAGRLTRCALSKGPTR